MDKFFVLFAIFAMAAAAACAVGCGDRSIDGDANGVSVDVSDDTFTIYGEVEPDESPPDGFTNSADENVLTAEEACYPYLGTWDCECTEGSCDIGSHSFFLIELLQTNGGILTFFVTQTGGVQFTMTCDPLHMPPTDSFCALFQITSPGQAKMTVQNPYNPNDWYILQCTPYN